MHRRKLGDWGKSEGRNNGEEAQGGSAQAVDNAEDADLQEAIHRSLQQTAGVRHEFFPCMRRYCRHSSLPAFRKQQRQLWKISSKTCMNSQAILSWIGCLTQVPEGQCERAMFRGNKKFAIRTNLNPDVDPIASESIEAMQDSRCNGRHRGRGQAKTMLLGPGNTCNFSSVTSYS